MTRMKENDLVAYGRCPSQGIDGALPIKVKRASKGEFSIRVPLDVCKLNTTDPGGDEAWVYKMASEDAIGEVGVGLGLDLVRRGAQEHHSRVTKVTPRRRGVRPPDAEAEQLERHGQDDVRERLLAYVGGEVHRRHR